ncbi:MAG: phytase [Pseudomonadales bacterium]|nr:phytase [Pseudomonadales bacterium]
MYKSGLPLLVLAALLSGCNSDDNDSPTPDNQNTGTVVKSDLITATHYSDIADATVWQDPENQNKHRLIVTLEGDGLAIFDENGSEVFNDDSSEFLGADIRYGIKDINGNAVDLLAVGLPEEESIRFFSVFDNTIEPLGDISLPVEPSAICLYKNITTGELTATATSEEGDVIQYKIEFENGEISSTVNDEFGDPIAVRHFNVGGELSACIIDDQNATLYVAEQDLGIWAYGSDAENVKERRLVDSIEPLGHLQEVEGLEMVYQPNGKGYLIAADEGAGFLVYSRDHNNDYLGKFEVDGIEEAKALAVANQALWLANTEADEPVYERVSTESLSRKLPDLDVSFSNIIDHRQLHVTGVSLVAASGETKEVDDDGDAADDPAFWLNPDDVSQSLIIATNKQGGLMAYDLQGNEIQYLEGGEPNNVDIRSDVTDWDGSTFSLAAASNRELNTIALYKISAASDTNPPIQPLTAIGEQIHGAAAELKSNVDEVYGLCLYQAHNGTPYVFVNGKNGTIEQWELSFQASGVEGKIVRTLSVATQPEGCVVDDETSTLYLGEEDHGIWSFSAEPAAATTGTLLASTDGEQLVADVEGLTIYNSGNEKYLIASSQGNNTYVIYDLNNAFELVGTFAIIGNDTLGVDGASDTDGIAATSANLGAAYPEGMFIAQDWYNIDPAYQLENQNFKLVSWKAIIERVR